LLNILFVITLLIKFILFMKIVVRIILCLFSFLFCINLTFGQAKKVKVSLFLSTESGDKPVAYIMPKEKRVLFYRNDREDLPLGNYNEYISISFLDENGDSLTMKEIGLTSIDIISKNESIDNVPVALGDASLKRFNVRLKKLIGTDNGEIIQIIINLENPDKYLLEKGYSYYFKYHKALTLYGAFNSSLAGFWFPTGMFASNFDRTDVGISFAPMPIGLAWGSKYNFKNGKGYIGASLCANWLIYEQKDTLDKSIHFQSISLGALFDISNYVTLGVTYGIDLTVNKKNPGLLFVVGIAPGILNLIKSSKK